MTDPGWFIGASPVPYQQRLDTIVEMMREMSLQTDPQKLVQTYGQRIRQLLPMDGSVSLSRRDLVRPFYRITRSNLIDHQINPWKSPEKLPMFDRGILGELIYSDRPQIINDLDLPDDDPGKPHLDGAKSIIALPLFDGGIAQNMVVSFKRQSNYFNPERLPEMVWISNLFGRATQNLVLSDQVKSAYAEAERELQSVAEIQRSLLPAELPDIPGLQLAAHYQTSREAGGDYYDFFPLSDGRWGIFMADVSGHGTSAAVLMAVTHSIAHTMPGDPEPPGLLLEFVNAHLCRRYTRKGTFVTAFYGIYDPRKRTLTYSRAGHCPPRVVRPGSLSEVDSVGGIPLGILDDEVYPVHTINLEPGDLVVFYTDGITEARNARGELFGLARLDTALRTCDCHVDHLMRSVLSAVDTFTEHRPATDDRTLLIVRIE
jgi:sigma-B regulation protein RsbU (phosphoserine phosphatase)